jgi:hypothetical protein
VVSIFIEPPSSPVTCSGSTLPSKVAKALAFAVARVQVPDQAAFAASELRSFKDGVFESRRRLVGRYPSAGRRDALPVVSLSLLFTDYFCNCAHGRASLGVAKSAVLR